MFVKIFNHTRNACKGGWEGQKRFSIFDQKEQHHEKEQLYEDEKVTA